MNIPVSQREMRSAFLGGFAGQLVSGLIWLVAVALAVGFAIVPDTLRGVAHGNCRRRSPVNSVGSDENKNWKV